MEFYETVIKRRTYRGFTAEDVSEEALQRILGAALKAPTNNHLRQWQFVILRTQDEKDNALRFAKAFADSHQTMPQWPGEGDTAKKMYSYAVPRQYSMLNSCPYVILPFFKAAPSLFAPTAINSYNTLAGAWCMIDHLLLAAADEGLGCSLRIPVGSESADVAAAIGAPEGWVMPCYIGLGHPSPDEPEIEQITPTLEEVIHRGKW